MEARGTTHSIQEIEQLLIRSVPYKIIHDGHFKASEFDPTKSASKIPAQSEVYTKLYQLFPPNKTQIWEERANVRFCYDKRHGTGTLKISEWGMHILGMQLDAMVANIKIGKTEIPVKDTVHLKP